MDLMPFQDVVNTPFEMKVISPETGEPLLTEDGKNVSIMAVRFDSDKFIEVDTQLSDKRIAEVMEGKKRPKVQSVPAIRAEMLDRVMACVVEVRNIEVNGVLVDANDKASVSMMFKKLPWLRRQFEAFINDDSNFYKAS